MPQRFVLFWLSCLCVVGGEKFAKLEPKFSIRGPHSGTPENWDVKGATTMQENVIRFTPQISKQPASMWTKEPVPMTSWEVILEFGVHGAAPLSTGEGLALWHAANPGSEGPVYGHSDRFSGLGIFFDSYDADGNGEGEPYVLAMFNDGTKPIDAEGAGLQLGVCFANYRNLPFPARAKIAYSATDNGHLTVGLDIENSGKFKSCISVKDVNLRPNVEHFGLTVADYGSDFDIFSLLAVNLDQQIESTQNKAQPDMIEVTDDVMGKDGQPIFESHTHFMKLTAKLQGLNDRLFALDEQFSKQFSAVFHNHNKALEFHVTKLQTDTGTKHTDLSSRLESVAKHADNIQRTLSTIKNEVAELAGTGGSFKGRDKIVDRLAQTRVSCVQDNHRSEVVLTQLKSMVETLQRRQETIKSDVHDTLRDLSADVDSGCGGGFKTVWIALLGVVVGSLVGSAVRLGKPRHHLP